MQIKQYKLARRLGARIFPKTENPKFNLAVKRPKTAKRPRPLSEYGNQLLEKQKVRFSYGIQEKQFSNYVKGAVGDKKANPVEQLYVSLESRLDNVVFRLGFVTTRRFGRQAVSHGHITVNGRKVTIPSYRVKKGDSITVRKESKDKGPFRDAAARLKEYTPPAWLSLKAEALHGTVAGQPTLGEYSEALFNLTSVIEYYSR